MKPCHGNTLELPIELKAATRNRVDIVSCNLSIAEGECTTAYYRTFKVLAYGGHRTFEVDEGSFHMCQTDQI